MPQMHFPAPSLSKRDTRLQQVLLIVGKTKGKANIYSPLLVHYCKIIACLLYFYEYTNCCNCLYCSRRGKQVNNVYLLGASIAVLMLVAIVVSKVRSIQRRKALEQILERYHQSGEALVRYIMLNRQCSEDAAYRRLATFVKKHVPLDDRSSIDRMLASDRQSLLDSTRSILIHDPDEIDKI